MRHRLWSWVGLMVTVCAGTAAVAAESSLQLEEIAERAGIQFQHVSGRSPARHLPETMGSGVAWLDFDGDGRWDLYLGNSGVYPPAGHPAAENRLFRNLGGGRFEDWTGRAGAGDRGYTQGVTAADFDGDGDTDLYLSSVGEDRLLINMGDGTFHPTAFEGADGWSSSAAFADADGDGDLDLYVTRYLEYQPDHGLFCGDPATGVRRYCDPSLFVGASDLYFENLGDGKFRDQTREAGFGAARGRGLGVLFADLDLDGAADVYVANDLTLNLIFRNNGRGRFEDHSLLSGAAVNVDGKPEAGMGVALGDVDGDGDADLLVTNFDVETNTLYENQGGLFFVDVAASSGVGPPSFNQLAFGVVLDDLDLDGDLDAYVGNGHIFEQPARENVLYRQPDQVLLNDGSGRFVPLPLAALTPSVTRGVAVADFDGDGDGDIAAVDNGGPFRLHENLGTPGRWLGVQLAGRAPNTAAVGARVVLHARLERGEEANGVGLQVRSVTAGDSYQSTSSSQLRFGLGEHAVTGRLEVSWPDGRVTRIIEPPVGRYLRVLEPIEKGRPPVEERPPQG